MARNVMLDREASQGANELLSCDWLEKAWNTLNNTKSVQRWFRDAKPRSYNHHSFSGMRVTPEHDDVIALFAEEAVSLYDPEVIVELQGQTVNPNAVDPPVHDLDITDVTSNESSDEDPFLASMLFRRSHRRSRKIHYT